MVAGKRGVRTPDHRFGLKMDLARITPFYFGAFLPGETVNDFFVDGRCLISGVKSVLFPWTLDIVFARVNLLDLDPDYDEQFYDARGAALHGGGGYTLWGQDSGGESYCKLAYDKLCDEVFMLEGHNVADAATEYRIAPPTMRGPWVSAVDSATVLEDPDLEEADLDPEHHEDLVDPADTMAEVLQAYGVGRSARRARGVEILMWEKMERYPIYVAPDDTSESNLTNRQVLFTIKESRLTTKGHYFDQPAFILGVMFVRPMTLDGNWRKFYANELMGRDRWFVPPFNALDAVQEGLLDPETGWGYTAPANPVYVNALDYWLNGESFINFVAASETQEVNSNSAKFPNYSASFMNEAELFKARATYPADDVPGLFQSTWFINAAGKVRPRVMTHLIEP